MVHNVLVDRARADTLELLVMVVVIVPHAPLLAQLPDAVKKLAAAFQVVQIPVGVKLNVAANLGTAQLRVVVQHRRQQLLPQGVHMAAHNLQAQVVQKFLQLPGRHAEAHPGVLCGVVVGRFHIAVAGLGDLPENLVGFFLNGVLHRVQLNADFWRHVPPPL